MTQLTVWLVGLDGAFVLATTLLDQIGAHRGSPLSDLVIDVPLLLGLSLFYLSTLLHRRKKTAWLVALFIYVFMLGLNVAGVMNSWQLHHLDLTHVLRLVVVPLAIISLLVVLRDEYTVRSDTAAFRTSLKFIILILLATLAYGIAGFLLLDKSDFHQEITVAGAVQRTVDQFDITTDHPLRAYTKRAHLFLDSLSFVSLGASAYAVISLFQPVRARLRDESENRHRLQKLLELHGAPSEDFFKLWPPNKHYFLSRDQTAGLALQVHRGVALCLGDPVGETTALRPLLEQFQEHCYVNDWLPAFVHTEATLQQLYERQGYSLQKIGQEAVVYLDHFETRVRGNKYFRNITNRFKRLNYTTELLRPPHHPALIDRLQVISNEWLAKPGRAERGFVMGYFTPGYMQNCSILVARDAAGTIQSFLNFVPAPFDTEEATYDLLRHSAHSPANSNDYLLLEAIHLLQEQGYRRLNLGLSPLVGITDNTSNQSLIDTFLRFAYVNGDRFYSFNGLKRFKDKYEPQWSDRFIVYKGGVRGFSRTMNALLRVMRVQ